MTNNIWEHIDYLKMNIPTDPQLRMGYLKAIEDLEEMNEGILCRGESRSAMVCAEKIDQRDFNMIMRYYYQRFVSAHKENQE